jgi:hypothetical protein
VGRDLRDRAGASTLRDERAVDRIGGTRMPSVRARRRWFALGLFVLWLLVAGFAGP